METEALVNSVRAELKDPNGVRFDDPALAEYLTSAGRMLAFLRPDEFSERAVVACVAGHVQTIPDDGLRLIEVSHNVDASDNPGDHISFVDERVLNRFAPSWRTETLVDAAIEYTWDDRRPREFLLVPPVNADVKVEISYAQDPGEIAVPGGGTWGEIPKLPESYYNVVRHWLLFRMYSEQTSQIAKAEAEGNWRQFFTMLGEKVPAEMRIDPRRAQAPARTEGESG